jgi:hypothetical protein
MKNEENNGNPDPSGNLSDDDELQALAELKGKKPLTRQECMELASELIRIMHARATSKRFKAQSKDAPRLAYARVVVPLLDGYSKLLKEHDLDEMEKRLGELERVRLRDRE